MSSLPTPVVVALILTVAIITIALGAALLDKITAPRRLTSAAAYAGRDLIPVHVALTHDPACRACAVYDRTLDEGIDALEDLANGERGAA